MSKEIMKIDELAEYIDLAESTIYSKVSNREIPYTKIGNLLRFPKKLIDQWLDKNTVHSDENLLNEFAIWHSRYSFKNWLNSKGINPREVSEEDLANSAKISLKELLEAEKEEGS